MSDLSTWMTDMPKWFRDRKINQIIFPGSWESGAYQTSSLWHPQYHDSSFHQQLKAGVRYLHLSIEYRLDHRDILLPMTGYYVTSSQGRIRFDDCMIQISSFCYAHPREVILVEIHPDASISNLDDLVSSIDHSWRDLIHPNTCNAFYSSLDQMTQRGERIVVLMNRETKSSLIWRPSLLIEPSSGQDFDEALFGLSKTLDKTITSPNRLMHLSWRLKMSWLDHLKMRIACYGPDKIHTDFNSTFGSFLEDNEMTIVSKVRIISFVWLRKEMLIQRVIKLNYKLRA